jgi:hypothetical protein
MLGALCPECCGFSRSTGPDAIFFGDRKTEIPIAENVRYRCYPPRFSTQRLPFLRDVADQTDLAAYNPDLEAELAHHDVLHTTHQLFTFGKTALTFAQRHRKPLVASIHTDVPRYTEIYTRQVLKNLVARQHSMTC